MYNYMYILIIINIHFYKYTYINLYNIITFFTKIWTKIFGAKSKKKNLKIFQSTLTSLLIIQILNFFQF